MIFVRPSVASAAALSPAAWTAIARSLALSYDLNHFPSCAFNSTSSAALASRALFSEPRAKVSAPAATALSRLALARSTSPLGGGDPQPAIPRTRPSVSTQHLLSLHMNDFLQRPYRPEGM